MDPARRAALPWRGRRPSPLRPRPPSAAPPHRSVRRGGRRWRSVRPEDPGAGAENPGLLSSGSFLFLPSSPRVSSSDRRQAFHEGAGTWGCGSPGRGRGLRQPLPPIAAPSFPGMWVEVPRSDTPGIGFRAGARGSRQVSVPDAPLNPPHLSPEPHSPSFYGGGAGGPGSKPCKEAGAPGRGAGGGGRLAFALFGVAALGAALCRRWGPGEASQRRRRFCGRLLPSPSGAAGLQLALGGWANSREGRLGSPGQRAEPRRLCSGPGPGP